MLDQDYADAQIEKLQGWLDSAGEIAREGKSIQEEAERIIGAMTDQEATAFWKLFAASEDILMDTGQRQLATSDAQLSYKEMRSVAALVYARSIIDYDPERGKLSTYLMMASRPHWRTYLRSVSPSSSNRRRVGRLLRQVRIQKKTHQGREPTLEEKTRYVQKRNSWMRGKTEQQAAAVIQEVESRKKPTSLDQNVGEEDGGRTLHDVLPSEPQVSIDAEGVARAVAQKTSREELLDRLLDEDPQPASLSDREARLIYLEREARGADPNQVAWEHSTSPYLVAQVENIYDLNVSIQDVHRYREAQGYETQGSCPDADRAKPENRSVSPEQVREICRRYHEENTTHAELAEDYPISRPAVGRVVRGETYTDVDRPT